jgi:hypothetical protein
MGLHSASGAIGLSSVRHVRKMGRWCLVEKNCALSGPSLIRGESGVKELGELARWVTRYGRRIRGGGCRGARRCAFSKKKSRGLCDGDSVPTVADGRL